MEKVVGTTAVAKLSFGFRNVIFWHIIWTATTKKTPHFQQMFTIELWKAIDLSGLLKIGVSMWEERLQGPRKVQGWSSSCAYTRHEKEWSQGLEPHATPLEWILCPDWQLGRAGQDFQPQRGAVGESQWCLQREDAEGLSGQCQPADNGARKVHSN